MFGRATLLVVPLLLAACIEVIDGGEVRGSGVTTMADVHQDVGGVVSAEIPSDSLRAQQVNASSGSAIIGAAVLFPPGSLKSTTMVQIAQGESVAHPNLPSELGLSGDIVLTEATRAVIVSSDKNEATADAFAIALPLTDPSDASTARPELIQDNIAIAFLAYDPARDRRVIGIIPGKEITIMDRRLHFMTKLFGLYQGVYTDQSAVQRTEQTTTRRILSSQVAATLPGVSWTPVTLELDNRSLIIASEPAGLAGPLSCAATVVSATENKTLLSAGLGASASGRVILGAGVTGTLRVRVTCTEDSGRTSNSAWSEPIEVAASELQ